MTGMNDRPPSVPCPQCQHPHDPHILIATDLGDPLGGGIIICNLSPCECYATWGVNGAPANRIPDAAELAHLRADLQTA